MNRYLRFWLEIFLAEFRFFYGTMILLRSATWKEIIGLTLFGLGYMIVILYLFRMTGVCHGQTRPVC